MTQIDMPLNEFISLSGAKSQTEVILLILYYNEVDRGRKGLTPAEIKEGFGEARITRPRNLSARLTYLVQRGVVQRENGLCQLVQAGLETAMAMAQPALTPDAYKVVADVSPHLASYLSSVADTSERDYLSEAMSCLKIGAYRAAVVLGWAAAIFNLRRKVQARGFDKFNRKFVQLYPKSRRDPVGNLDDLEEYRDSELLRVCNGIGILSDTAYKHLKPQLDLRNTSGHPTEDKPELYTVGSFFERLIQFIFSQA